MSSIWYHISHIFIKEFLSLNAFNTSIKYLLEIFKIFEKLIFIYLNMSQIYLL